MQKTIVFCATEEHAERMRVTLNNFNADMVQRILIMLFVLQEMIFMEKASLITSFPYQRNIRLLQQPPNFYQPVRIAR